MGTRTKGKGRSKVGGGEKEGWLNLMSTRKPLFQPAEICLSLNGLVRIVLSLRTDLARTTSNYQLYFNVVNAYLIS